MFVYLPYIVIGLGVLLIFLFVYQVFKIRSENKKVDLNKLLLMYGVGLSCFAFIYPDLVRMILTGSDGMINFDTKGEISFLAYNIVVDLISDVLRFISCILLILGLCNRHSNSRFTKPGFLT